MYDPSPIGIVAPAPRRRFKSSKEALAYYDAMGVQNREDILVLLELARAEMQKINEIFGKAIERMEADSNNTEG